MKHISEVVREDIFYNPVDDKDVRLLIQTIKNGIPFAHFIRLAERSPFSLAEWSGFYTFQKEPCSAIKEKEIF
jgi:hypothetical protein